MPNSPAQSRMGLHSSVLRVTSVTRKRCRSDSLGKVFSQKDALGCIFDLEEHISIPSIRSHTRPVSRLPKALFRELNGRCSYQRCLCLGSRHQISMTTLSGKYPSLSVHPTSCGRIAANVSRRVWNSPAWVAAAPLTNCERNEPMTRSTAWKRIIKIDDSRPCLDTPGSRADTRGFREGRPGRCEKPDRQVSWNRQRCYRVHPYWTNNLKYVY